MLGAVVLLEPVAGPEHDLDPSEAKIPVGVAAGVEHLKPIQG